MRESPKSEKELVLKEAQVVESFRLENTDTTSYQ